MDQAKIDEIIDGIIEREGKGKYTDRKNDRGGPTFEGVTWKTYASWCRKHGREALGKDDFAVIGRCAAKDPNHALRRQVREIYCEEYIDRFRGLPKGLREMTIDAGVNCGWPRAARWTQQAVGAHPDGVVGPATLRAARELWRTAAARRAALIEITGQRLEFYVRLARRRPQQMANLLGWTRRAVAVLGEAMEMHR